MLRYLGAPPDPELQLEARPRRRKIGLFKEGLRSVPSCCPAVHHPSVLTPHGIRGSAEVLESTVRMLQGSSGQRRGGRSSSRLHGHSCVLAKSLGCSGAGEEFAVPGRSLAG